MVTDSAAIIMFAIKSAVKLSQQVRLAYMEATRARELTLPLPNFFTATRLIDAVEYFENADLGGRYILGFERDGVPVPGIPRIGSLLERFNANTLTPDDGEEILLLFKEYKNLDQLESNDGSWSAEGLTAEAMNTLLTVRQWRRGMEDQPSALKRIGGTLLEIGVDYALTQPDLFDENSAKGRAIKGFLTAVDDISFATMEPSELPAQLFVAAIETVAKNPDLAAGDEKVQELVRVTAESLGKNAKTYLDKIDEDAGLDIFQKRSARRNVGTWTSLVFRSVLDAGARTVLDNPGRFLGVDDEGKGELVESIGTAVLDLILSDTTPKVEALFSKEGLDTVLKAALEAVAEHPEILTDTDNQGVKKIITETARSLTGIESLTTPDVLPEIARIVLAKSGENLALLLPDLTKDQPKILLLTAASTTIRILTEKPADGSWSPSFSRSDLLTVVEAVVDEVAANPGWILTAAGNVNSNLSVALQAALNVIKERGDKRLGSALAVQIVKESVRAVALRKEFLNMLPATPGDTGKRVVTAAIDAVLATVFDPSLEAKAKWQLLRNEVISGMIEVSMDRLSRTKLGAKPVDVLKEVIENQVKELTHGKRFDIGDFTNALDEKLKLAA